MLRASLTTALFALGLVVAPAVVVGQQRREAPAGGMNDAAMAADAQMSADDPFMERAHIALSPARPRNNADSARAAAIAAALRRALEPYRDVRAAERDGYQIFAPEIPGQHVYHFNNYAYAMANDVNFDPTKPTSLLYRKGKDGTFTLEGAMYTAPPDLPLDSLDQRVPLSVARWHRHVNFCVPAGPARGRWREMRGGRPVFGPRGVATRAECEAAGGRFHPQVFGWMVHTRPFASDDPYVVFGIAHGH
jgi:hypothetical protein